MNTKNQPYDLYQLMDIVEKNQGILRDKVMFELGAKSIDRKSRSKIYQAQKKLKGRLFIQKKGAKCFYYTARYAADNDIPQVISVEKRTSVFADDIERESVMRMSMINKYMRPVRC